MKILLILLLFLLPLLLCESCKTFSLQKPLPIKPDCGQGIILLSANGFVSWGDRWGYMVWEPSYLEKSEMKQIKKQVREYFSLWDVVVTEDQDIFYQYPTYQRVRVVLTKTFISRVPGDTSLGLSFMGAMTGGDTSSSLVDVKATDYNINDISLVIVHEVGHQLGMSHLIDSTYFIDGEMWMRFNTHVPGKGKDYGPIMGQALHKKYRSWSEGENTEHYHQNDTAIISQSWRRIK